MKSFIPTLMIALFLAVSCDKNPNSPAKVYTWTPCATLPADGVYKDIFFIDADEGWLVGQSDRIFHSENGGESWELQHSGNGDLSTVDFLDKQYGWATELVASYYTTDGGTRWNYVDIVGYLSHIAPLTYKVIFIDRQNILIFHRNAGNSFVGVTRRTFNADSAKFSWIDTYYFPSYLSAITHLEYNIWVADVKQNLYLSTDGGETWSTGQIEADSSGEISAINDIRFTDEENGWFCSDASVYYSEDGGNNWHYKATLPDISLSRICFFDNKGWVMGGQAIYYSSDGGDSWEEQFRIDEGDILISLSFVNKSHGWALSQGGKVYRYGEE